jgi:hypothetical protein
MDKTPLDMSYAYAGDDKAIQQAWEEGFVAGISWEIERRTKEIMEENTKNEVINNKAQAAWENVTKGLLK